MGGDGGSIARRTDLVRVKAKQAAGDRRNLILAAWFTCALSKNALVEPVVADALGRLYNKDAVIEYFLSGPDKSLNVYGADGIQTCSHLRSLKDLHPLNLTPATHESVHSLADPKGGQSEYADPLWMCPISLRGMNGSVPFVYVKHCGCVLSEAGLKQVVQVSDADNAACPVCATQLPTKDVQVVTINPSGKEKEEMAAAWTAHIEAEARLKAEKKAAKKSSKRAAADDSLEPVAKKVKKKEAPTVAPTSTLDVAVKKKVQEQKAAMTPAVASLYAPKNSKQSQQTWMTMGTFNRYA